MRFGLNSGQRTIAEQRVLYNRYRNGTGNLAAYPNPNAPHIRVGRANHALDINSLDGGETRLERWVEGKGVDWRNTVRGESWHGEVSLSGLAKLARGARGYFKEKNKWACYTSDEKRWIQEYDRLLKARKGRKRREVLRGVMKAQRQEIYRAAAKSGWKNYNRRKRYASLLVRSR